MVTCTIDDCDKPIRSRYATLCKMHYHRQYRHGSTDKVARGLQTGPGRRYLKVTQPDHPLAMINGQVYVHRAALWDKIGLGPHPCHWCSRSLDWQPKPHPDRIEVDHLNSIGDDNRPENLVPSCHDCNAGRGAQARHARLVAAGFWSVNDTVAITDGRRPLIEASSR